VVLTYNGDAGDSLTVVNALANDGRGIESYQFADGVSWDKAKLRSLLSNKPPVATDDGYFSATSGQPLALVATTLLANDYDPNGDAIKIVSADGGANGTAGLDALGNRGVHAQQRLLGRNELQIYDFGWQRRLFHRQRRCPRSPAGRGG
jgi:Haemolysin-type calcium binding protein related domain.